MNRFVLPLACAAALLSGNSTSAQTIVNCAANPGALAAELAAATPGSTLTIAGTCRGVYTIDRSLTLVGKSGAVIDGGGMGTVLSIVAGVHVTIDTLIITGGASGATDAVGGIANSGGLQIRRSTVTGNAARGVNSATGGIRSGPLATSWLTLEDSAVVDNSGTVLSAASGTATGGIRTDGPVTLLRTNVSHNRAYASTGLNNRALGGMAIGPGPGYMHRITVKDNFAQSEHTGSTGSTASGPVAGAIGGITHFPSHDDLMIDSSLIHGNRAIASSAISSGAVGGMVNRFTLTNTDVIGNTAQAGTFAAGGIANQATVLALESTNVVDNTATATEPGGVAAGGVSTGYLGPASTSILLGKVNGNIAHGVDVAGGLYRVAGNGSYVLEQVAIGGNLPIDCNFQGCQ
jgi:hypothetical protein